MRMFRSFLKKKPSKSYSVLKRFNSFTRLSDPSLGTLPPSRKGLTEHTKELSCTRILRYGVGKTTEGGRYYPQWYLKGDTS